MTKGKNNRNAITDLCFRTPAHKIAGKYFLHLIRLKEKKDDCNRIDGIMRLCFKTGNDNFIISSINNRVLEFRVNERVDGLPEKETGKHQLKLETWCGYTRLSLCGTRGVNIIPEKIPKNYTAQNTIHFDDIIIPEKNELTVYLRTYSTHTIKTEIPGSTINELLLDIIESAGFQNSIFDFIIDDSVSIKQRIKEICKEKKQ